MKNLLYFMCGLLFLYSCKAELIDKRIEEKSIERTSSRIKNDREMAKSMLRFSEIFSEAISKHVELRQFIKAEALKEFNNDYDVFYPFVKNENVLNDRSFRELLIDYSSEKEILDIEDALPLLTIYVPELPSGFDAETWDFVNEKPYVTATVIQNDHMKFYKDGSLHDSINKLYIPGFPVLVVKNNERVRLKSDSFPRLKSSNITTKESYEFVDDAYNGSIKSKGIFMPGSSYLIPEVITAYDSMGVSGYTWQRDHIYYGLTLNTVDRGPLNHRIIERIVALGFSSDAYFAMSDQPGDPKIKGGFYHKKKLSDDQVQNEMWTDGRFDIEIHVLINSKSGLGTTIEKHFSAPPQDLFHIEYTRINNGINYFYMINEIIPKTYYTSIDLVSWNLEDTGFSWKFIFYEKDEQIIQTITNTNSIDFASNFQLNLGLSEKVGLNFGSSAKSTVTNTHTLAITQNSDHLGTLEIDFAAPVIVSRFPFFDYYRSHSISNPYVALVLLPVYAY